MKNLFLYPYWIIRLASGAKSFRDNRVIGSKWMNRKGLHVNRMRLAHAMAWGRRNRLAPKMDRARKAQFDENGFILVPDYLQQSEFEQLQACVYDRSAPAREMPQGDTITRRIAIDDQYLRQAPIIRKILSSPAWTIMMHYVSSYRIEPLYYVQTILKSDVTAERDPQTNLHCDTFHPTMKAWFFLHDVAENEGPFMYVPGSHKLSAERLAWEQARSIAAPEGVDFLSSRGSMRIDEAELAQLNLPPPRKFAVKANTLIIADTCGFHARSPSSGANKRIEIWAYSRRNPFLPWLGGDLLSMKSLAYKRISALWRVRDKLDKYIGQPWRNVGQKKPTDD